MRRCLKAPLNFHLHRWTIPTTPKAVVQIVHGMAEHGGRYAALATTLNAAGYAVYANDLRGHGRTAGNASELGFLADSGGWQKCLDDLLEVNRRIVSEHPGIPVFILGHSLGSLMTQQFMSEHGGALAGVILSATDGGPGLLARAGRVIARIERMRLGARGRSRLIQTLSFGSYNKTFAPTRTRADWLSRDAPAVDAYLADPLCGFVPTVQLWIDVLDALGDLSNPTRLAGIPRQLPIHLITGALDPVSARGAGVRRLLAAYKRAGLERVTARFYDGARHELFHETNRTEVTRDVIAWLDGIVAARQP